MVDGTETAGAGQERRTATRTHIDRLLAERRELLVLFEKVAGVAPYDDGNGPDAGVLDEFDRILVDYLAAGHFGLYERIAEGKERRQGVVELAAELYPQITATTGVAMAFNDAYERSGRSGLTPDLTSRIDGLGEALAQRIELEDRLIEKMLVPR